MNYFKQPFPSLRQYVLYKAFVLILFSLSFSPVLFADSEKSSEETTLISAVLNGKTEEIDAILANPEIDPNAQNDSGRTALIFASGMGESAIVGKLLGDERISTDRGDKYGRTALMWASIKGHLEIVQKLIDHGVTIEKKDKEGKTALTLALENKLYDVVNLLHAGMATTPINKSQSKIIHKIGLYQEKFLSGEANLIEKDSEGICNGLTALWLYAKWLDTQPENSEGKNSDWFNRTVKSIVGWDETRTSAGNEKNDFKELSQLANLLQHGEAQEDLGKGISSSKLYTAKKILKKKYQILSVFTYEQLCDLLNEIVYDDELIQIYYESRNIGHVVGIFKHGENYYYYDANNYLGEIKANSIDKIAKIIFTASRYYYCAGKPTVLTFTINSFDENNHLYPSIKEYLTKLNSPVDSDVLILSVEKRNIESVDFFLRQGVDPNRQDEDDMTALSVAAINGDIEILDKLIKGGAKIRYYDVIRAKKGGCEKCIKLLKQNYPDYYVDWGDL